MRKRAQRKSKIPEDGHSYKLQKEISGTEKRKFSFNKKWWTAISLIGIFFLIIVLNTYFNVSSGTTINTELQGLDQYYLSGPDPYYNMRLVDETLYGENAGQYPFYSEGDPLLNYPIGRSGGRAPLFNMMAIGFSRLLIPFMNEIDAIGYSMQFIPALFGALLIFPIYFIGKTLFGKKEGLLAALLIALIPIHLSSGHGSAYTLFDHDSFNLFLFFTLFIFIIWSIKEKNRIKSLIYAALAGIPLAALTMTWVEA
ncbi:MAG: glycosyltransferase family 39 protein, partial [Thermoplasmatales archaeon]|nr:glycosyltransferase family 39 protein [Thermoplasmatales archaeon]